MACTVTVAAGDDVASQLSPDAVVCLGAGVHLVNLDLTHGVTLRGEPGTVPHSGSSWYRVSDAALTALKVVTLSLKDPREDGLLRSGERQRIDRLEDRLDHAIGRDGVKTGVATADGKHTLTWFVDPDAAVDGRVDALLQPRSWSASVETELDLDWADRV